MMRIMRRDVESTRILGVCYAARVSSCRRGIPESDQCRLISIDCTGPDCSWRLISGYAARPGGTPSEAKAPHTWRRGVAFALCGTCTFLCDFRPSARRWVSFCLRSTVQHESEHSCPGTIGIN